MFTILMMIIESALSSCCQTINWDNASKVTGLVSGI